MNEQLEEYEKEAIGIFRGSKSSLMAHTIRAVEKLFLENDVALDVLIERDEHGRRIKGNVVSVLNTRFFAGVPIPRVTANICIHNHATRNLARYCIAHEIYHLILEFRGYLKSGREIWPNLAQPVVDGNGKTKKEKMEDECDCFAQRLCLEH